MFITAYAKARMLPDIFGPVPANPYSTGPEPLKADLPSSGEKPYLKEGVDESYFFPAFE